MSEWKKVKLGELYEVHNGLSKGRQYFGSGYPFLTFSTVFNNWFLPSTLDSLVQSSEKERTACSIKRGDVFITRTSETMDELGMSSVALKDYPNATYNGFTKRLRPITDEVIPEYIGYYLRSKKFRGKFMAFSSMTTRASLANDDLLSMEVEIPEKSTQQHIATILSRYDSLIENYQKQIKLLEEAAQRLYKEWFVDLHFPDHENTKIVDGVPEGWEKKRIAELGTVITGKTPSTSKRENYGGSIPFITIPDMHTGIFPVSSQFLSDIGANSQKGKYIPVDSIMVSCIGTAGLVCISSRPCQTNQQINSLVLHDKRFLYFLYYAFLMLKEHLNNIGSNGATMTNVNKSKFESISLLIPTGNLISSYNDKAKPFFKNIRLLSSQIRLLTEARDRLLPKLMSGEIAVDGGRPERPLSCQVWKRKRTTAP